MSNVKESSKLWSSKVLNCPFCNSEVEVEVREDSISDFDQSFKDFNKTNNFSMGKNNFKAMVDFFASELDAKKLKEALKKGEVSEFKKSDYTEDDFPLKVVRMKSLSLK